MVQKFLFCLTITASLILFGCGKKDSEQDQLETSSIPEVAGTTETDEPADDIFDEFYEEESSTEATDAVSEEPTFSTADYSSEFTPDGRYVVQVSCVASEAIAQSHVDKLVAAGFPAYLAQVENPTPDLLGTYYRVRVGAFRGVTVAKSFGAQVLTQMGYNYWVDNKSNDNVGMGGYGLGGSSTESEYETYSPSTTYEEPASSEWESESSAQTTEADTWGETATETVESTAATATEAVETATETAQDAAATAASTVDNAAETATEAAGDAAATATESVDNAATGATDAAGDAVDEWGDDWGSDAEW